MTTIVVFVIAGLIFAWDWYRLYQHNIKKGTRPLIAHMLGFMLGIFPAQFFLYASFASFPPPEIEPPSTLAIVSLCHFRHFDNRIDIHNEPPCGSRPPGRTANQGIEKVISLARMI